MVTLAEWLQPTTIKKALYTPAELERISGLGADMQRVWRRRGQLPSHGAGHARFSIPEVIEITLRNALSRAGVPPSERFDLSVATSAAMLHAVFCDSAVEIIGPISEVEYFLKVFDEDQSKLGSFLVDDPLGWFYLVINDRRESRVVDEPANIVANDEELNFVFNLALVGALLVERGRKPLVSVRFPDVPHERTIRRLTG